MSPPTRRCGRPPVLSFLEKKRRKQSLDRRRGRTRIYVGSHIERWLTLREKLDFRSDADVAGFLLDLYDSCDPKAAGCALCERGRRSAARGDRPPAHRAALAAAERTYDNDGRLPKESACPRAEDGRIVPVKGEREAPQDCSLADDTTTSKKKIKHLRIGSGAVFGSF